MTDDRRPRHPFNRSLVLDGILFAVVLLVGITFYVLAFHPF